LVQTLSKQRAASRTHQELQGSEQDARKARGRIEAHAGRRGQESTARRGDLEKLAADISRSPLEQKALGRRCQRRDASKSQALAEQKNRGEAQCGQESFSAVTEASIVTRQARAATLAAEAQKRQAALDALGGRGQRKSESLKSLGEKAAALNESLAKLSGDESRKRKRWLRSRSNCSMPRTAYCAKRTEVTECRGPARDVERSDSRWNSSSLISRKPGGS